MGAIRELSSMWESQLLMSLFSEIFRALKTHMEDSHSLQQLCLNGKGMKVILCLGNWHPSCQVEGMKIFATPVSICQQGTTERVSLHLGVSQLLGSSHLPSFGPLCGVLIQSIFLAADWAWMSSKLCCSHLEKGREWQGLWPWLPFPSVSLHFVAFRSPLCSLPWA